ncbi:FecR family protein [Sphingobacterium bambusae]|uniref:FecR family protein n=1 Tax=Sphingobacterium bambusae TaxID=662858 RepID=A0ABW6BNP8_9SPHI|nr:FecR domain-containing protein [Sphingobacterium bambusae]WPL48139.1 FecR domain-containing protein [Sphingobacterium bambusae]
MKKKIFHFLTYRYHQGTASKQEKQLFDRWYQSLDQRQEVLPTDLPEREQRSLNHILQVIDSRSVVDSKTSFKSWKWFAGVAAVLLCITGITVFIQQFNQVETKLAVEHAYRIFETQVGERKELALPDGSKVILNARSSLRIDEKQYGKVSRTVELLTGEAFFDVEKDSSLAFIVLAGPLQTRVLGTSFGIQAYPEMAAQVVSVYSGRVQVQHGEHTLGILTYGEQIRFDKVSANSALLHFDADRSKSWMSGRSFLRQASFSELALAIRNNYGITLKAGDERIVRQQYSLPIQERVPFKDVLQAICKIHNNRSRKEGDTVLIY